MRLFFSIHYYTHWGQYLGVNIKNHNSNLLLTHIGDGVWSGSLEINEPISIIEYAYFVYDEKEQTYSFEWGAERKLRISKKWTQVLCNDHWKPSAHENNPFYSSAFTEVIFKQKPNSIQCKEESSMLTFKASEVKITEDQCLCIIGNMDELGNWDLHKPLLLSNQNFPEWEASIQIKNRDIPVLFKFGIYSFKEEKVVQIEDHKPRVIEITNIHNAWVYSYQNLNFGNRWKGAGIAVPVFSLRTQNSLGVGDFCDLIPMIDFAVASGFKMVQILPINDTSATLTNADSYPYASISVFALHPIYLNLEKIGIDPKLTNTVKAILNAKKDVDYEEVIKLKLELTRKHFDTNYKEILDHQEYKNFVNTNKAWLLDYACFSYLRDYFGTVNFENWEEFSVYSPDIINQLISSSDPRFKTISFYCFIQHQLHIQLHEVSLYARKNKVVLKGDLPIGIFRYSVDAWVAPHLYNMNGQAGAPPDPFSDTGQNWGFPTYNWEEMAKDDYQWWKNRFQQLSQYFDAFRIDHILGFFRIWEIPLDQVDGLMGRFNPALPLYPNDFLALGIEFNSDRFCNPFIDSELLKILFKETANQVQKIFLTHDFQLRPEFSNQKKIKAYLDTHPEYQHLEKELFSLVTNVLMLEDEKGGFHPRIDLMKNYSFQKLPGDQQKKLLNIYYNYFYSKQEDYWERQGLLKLPAIKNSSNMLICGEDLGMVPACVPKVMKKLDILSLEIQRMSKNPDSIFLNEVDIPYHSVMSPSTHDMSPVRLWWEESEKDYLKKFFHEELGFGNEFICEFKSFIAERMIAIQSEWKGMWAVFPLQDLMAMDEKLWRENPEEERINIPSDPKHFWKFRFHLSMEELLDNNIFQNKIKGMLSVSGR